MAYRSSSANTGGGGADPSVAVPSGAAIGDIVILAVNCDGTAVTNTFPAGFTSFGEQELTLDGQTVEVGWKRLTAADAGTYTIVSNSTLDWVCQAAAFSGRDPELAPEQSTTALSNSGNSSPATISANGVTAVDGDDLCWVGATDRSTNSGTVDYTAPTNFTERQDTLNQWASMSVATRDNVSAGATGNIDGTVTFSAGTSAWVGWTIRIPEDDGVTSPSVAGTGAATSGTTTTSVTISKPSGTAVDDILYAVVTNGNANAAPSTVPSGWTLIASAGEPADALWGGVYRRIVDGSEGADFTWSGFTSSCTGCMVAVRNCDVSGTPELASSARHNASGTNGADSISTDANHLVLAFAAVDDNAGTTSGWSLATLGSMTEEIQQASSGGVDSLAAIASVLTSSGSTTGDLSFSVTGGDNNVGILIAVKPAGGGATNLVIQQATHAHAADNVALTQDHDLVVQDASHAHTADNLALTQTFNLVIADALHAHTADGLTLTVSTTLAVADTQHAHSADNLALTQDHDLTVADATHAHTVDSLTLTQVHTLVIAEAIHGHTADNLTLSTEASLSINDALHSHTVDSLSLTQVHNQTTQDATHAHTADNVVLSTAGDLNISETVHAHSADNVALEQVHVLSIDQVNHAHTADNVVLVPGAINLVIADAVHSHTADSLTLTVTFNLTVADATHSHTADSLSLTQTHIIVVEDAHHLHIVDNVTLAGAAYRFEPPTHEEPMRTDTKPLSYYRLTYAATVLRAGATFIQRRTPSPEVLEAAGTEGTDWFRGGCVYTITEDVADELVAAGYSVTQL